MRESVVGRKALLLIATFALLALAFAISQSPRPAVAASACSSRDTSPRNPANPLDSVTHQGSDPLNGFRGFVDTAVLNGSDPANAIARAIGEGWRAKNYGQYGAPLTWAQFKAHADSRPVSAKTRSRIRALEKIGDQPYPHQYSVYTAGGSPSAIFSQAQGYLCRLQKLDPTSTAVMTTYFLRHSGHCFPGTVSPSDRAHFQGEVDALKRAIGNFSVLIFMEEDAITTAACLSQQGLRDRESEMKYEIGQLSQLPHALVYVEGGTCDANPARFSAKVLNASGANRVRGFFLNDTHFNWASCEITFGNKISSMTGGLHFVVDTRADGHGPKKTKHPVTQGNEVLCNPPGRGLGPPPQATDGKYSSHLDGFGWATVPGLSAAKHCPGRSQTFAASGVFDENYAIGLARRANSKVGPGYPSMPY